MTKFKTSQNSKGKKSQYSIVNTEPSRTEQAHAGDCDINTIMRRYEKTGILPEAIRQNPEYGDFADVPSYQEAQNIFVRSREQFDMLPASVRDRFRNDPVRFLAFMQDENNFDEMVTLGLAKRRAANDQGSALNGDVDEHPKTSKRQKHPPVPKEPEDQQAKRGSEKE